MEVIPLIKIVSLPFNLYDTFVIEQQHGFNKQTIGFYFKDQVKKLAITFGRWRWWICDKMHSNIENSVLSIPVMLAVEWIIEHGGSYFFVYVWVFLSVVIFLLMTIYPEFIAPLFDKVGFLGAVLFYCEHESNLVHSASRGWAEDCYWETCRVREISAYKTLCCSW